VLGAGLQGSACAYDLLQQDAVDHVTLADIQPDRAAAFVKPFTGSGSLMKLDVQDPAAARRDAGHVAVANAPARLLQPRRHAGRGETGLHYADLGGNTEIVFNQKKLDAEAKARHVSVISTAGSRPGW
jgi:lysine 6-dehydrogenase